MRGRKREKGSVSPAAAAIRRQVRQGKHEDLITSVLQEAREGIRQRMTPAQIEDPSDEDMRLGRDVVEPLVEGAFRQARQQGMRMTRSEDETVRQIMDEIFGFGPLAPYLNNPEVEEVVVNGPDDIWIIHAGRGKERTNAAFRSVSDVVNFVNRAASATSGRWLDRSTPKIDARMRDGSRLHAVAEPLTVNVPIAVTIRRHRLVARTLEDLVGLGTVTASVKAFLGKAVDGRLNIVVAGGTASGKTNFLNAMCDAASDADRFVVIEDTPELQVDKPDVVQLTTRDQAEEAEAFTIADLVIESLRMRPDRIITGEARGPEIADVLMAANTGHDGQMLTVHANSTRDVIQRMETMYLLRGHEIPITAIRRQIADAFQLIVFLKRVFIGETPKRFVTEIAEMQPSQFMEGDKVVVQNVYEDTGNGLGWTGYYPERLCDRLERQSIHLPPAFFRS